MRVIIMAAAGCTILLAAVGAFGEYQLWAVLAGVLVMPLAAVAK